MTNREMQNVIWRHCDSHRKEHGDCVGCPLLFATSKKQSCSGSDADIPRNYGILLGHKEAVDHPSHYNQGKYECIEVMIEVFGIEAVKHFCLLNAFKYNWRTGEKNGNEDIEKGIWYLNKYLELATREVSE